MTTVEDCRLVLCVNDLVRAGVLVPGRHRATGTWRGMAFEACMSGPECWIGLVPLRQKIRLTSRPMPNGGQRWFMIAEDGRPVCRMYLPPGGDYFRSRQGYDLQYMVWTVGWKRRRKLRTDGIVLEMCGVQRRRRRARWLEAKLREINDRKPPAGRRPGPIRQFKAERAAATVPTTPPTVEPAATHGPDRPSSAADELWERMSWPSLRPRIIRDDED
jgi:hypothetical protein